MKHTALYIAIQISGTAPNHNVASMHSNSTH